ncbi:hypothetical protein N0V85_009292 [Neurospora sp. IMI 360204]|nr:hypothetical protein N0V85_009292 [Neurospora sp. IMI 360204]
MASDHQESLPPRFHTASDVRAKDGRVMIRTDNHEEREEWDFEKLIDCAQLGGNHHWYYQVKWKGDNQPTWEPKDHVIDCEEMLQRFHNEHPDKPIPPDVQDLLARMGPPAPAASPAPAAPEPPPRRSARLAQRETTAAVTTPASRPLDGTLSEYEIEGLEVAFARIFRRLMDVWSGRVPKAHFVDYDQEGLEADPGTPPEN